MWSFAEEGSHATEGGGFVTSGAMLHFVKERILTTDVNKAGKTIVPLVVVAINLLFFPPPINLLLCREKVRWLRDVTAWPWKGPMGPGPPLFPDTEAAEEAAFAFSSPERRGSWALSTKKQAVC